MLCPFFPWYCQLMICSYDYVHFCLCFNKLVMLKIDPFCFIDWNNRSAEWQVMSTNNIIDYWPWKAPFEELAMKFKIAMSHSSTIWLTGDLFYLSLFIVVYRVINMFLKRRMKKKQNRNMVAIIDWIPVSLVVLCWWYTGGALRYLSCKMENLKRRICCCWIWMCKY